MTYVPKPTPTMVWGRPPSVTYEEYAEKFAYYLNGGPKKPTLTLVVPSLRWECAGAWTVAIGLYVLAYMTWGM